MTLIRINGLLLALATLLALVGCGKDDPPANNPPPTSIRFDSNLPAYQQEAIREAMQALNASPLIDPDPTLVDLTKLPNASSDSIRTWIEDRVAYVLPQDFPFESRIVELSTSYNFPNPGQLPAVIEQLKEESKGTIVMSNPGALLYCVGKKENTLLGLAIEGVGTVRISSPRTGILLMGPGMFEIPEQYKLSKSMTNKFRLSTLIHEARHSDSNRTTTGFFHEKCVSGDYQGRSACDKNTNGPYSIEAALQKSLLRSCQLCGPREQQFLKLIYLDSVDRVIPNSPRWDDSPEGQR